MTLSLLWIGAALLAGTAPDPSPVATGGFVDSR